MTEEEEKEEEEWGWGDHDPKSSPRFIDRLKNSNSPTVAIPPYFSQRRESLISFQCVSLMIKSV